MNFSKVTFSRILSNKQFWILQTTLLLTLSAIAYAITSALLEEIKSGMLSRDAEAIALTINTALDRKASSYEELDEVQLIEDVLNSLAQSRALSIKIFDYQGFYICGLPENILNPQLDPSILELLEDASHMAYLIEDPASESPQIDSYVQISYKEIPMGYVRYIISGEGFSEAYNSLEDQIFNKSIFLVLLGYSALSFLICLNFYKSIRSTLLLEKQHRILEKTNHQLIFASKTEAVGSVAAHLVHGLKNSLSEISLFLESQKQSENQNERHAAYEALAKANSIVSDVIQIFQDTNSVQFSELSVREWMEDLHPQLNELVSSNTITLNLDIRTDAPITIRQASIATLVIKNLLQNAIEADTSENTIRLEAYNDQDGCLKISIQDNGTGISTTNQDTLFHPKISKKENGSGIGLALSRSLMRSIGGDLYHCAEYSNGAKFICRFTPKPNFDV